MGVRKALRVAAALVALSLSAASPKIGQPAPEGIITLIDKSKVSLSSLRGQVVILNFWATWCAPCREELPLLDRYYQLVASRGIRVFAIEVGDVATPGDLKKLFSMLHLTPARAIKGPYHLIQDAIPTNYIIDRAGKLRYAKASALDLDDLNRELVPLINEPAPPPLPAATPGAT